MRHSTPAFRLVALLILGLAFLPTPSLAQEVDCDDFTSPDAAQILLDDDPDAWEEALDPDGNGIACDQDNDDRDPDERTDPDTWLDSVAEQADAWSGDLDTLIDLDPIHDNAGLSEDDLKLVNDILARFADAPDAVADFDSAPDDLADVEDAFRDLADGYAAITAAAISWNDTDPGSDEEDEAAAAYDDAVGQAGEMAGEFVDLVETTRDGGSSNNRENDPDRTEDVDTYLHTVFDHAEDLYRQTNRLSTIMGEIALGSATDADLDEADDISRTLADASDVASGLDVPDGYDHIQDAYIAYTGACAGIAAAWDAWVDSRPGSAENTNALIEFSNVITEAAGLASDLFSLLSEEGL